MPNSASSDPSGRKPKAKPKKSAEPDAVLARRAQMLATEHWSLLAARGTAQSEVLTRVSIFLTLVSAALVTIGLLGQAMSFDRPFAFAALGILGLLVLVGVVTQMRVGIVAEEDMMYVIAMNRIRGAYEDIDPEVSRYFLTSTRDDMAGTMRTYGFFRPQGSLEHLAASLAFFSGMVTAVITGLFVGGLLYTLGMSIVWSVVSGCVVGALVICGFLVLAGMRFREAWRVHRPLKRTPEQAAGADGP